MVKKCSVLPMTVPSAGGGAARWSSFRERGGYAGSRHLGATFAPYGFGTVEIIAAQRGTSPPCPNVAPRKNVKKH